MLDMPLRHFLKRVLVTKTQNRNFNMERRESENMNSDCNVPSFDSLIALSELANSCQFMHQECGVVHRDLTCDNIMVRIKNNKWKKSQRSQRSKMIEFDLVLTNFGFATDIKNSMKMRRGSMRHYAPESIGNGINYVYNFKSDVFSFGNVLIEYIENGELIFGHLNTKDAIDNVISGVKPTISVKCMDDYEQLIEKCLQTQNINRPTMGQIAKMLRQMTN